MKHIEKIKNQLTMVYGGNVRVYSGKKYVGTYMDYWEFRMCVKDATDSNSAFIR